MPNVTFEKTSNVTGRLALTLPAAEISKKLNAELKKEAKRVNIKGFRKGKTPVSALRKLMGNQLLAPLLDREIQQALFGYIEDNDLRLIFSPQPIEDSNVSPITATSLRDLDLKYELALEPEFELTLPDEAFDLYVFEASDEFLDEQVTTLRRNQGEQTEVTEGGIEDQDVLDVTFREIDGELENDTKLFVSNLSEALRQELLGQAVGFTTELDDLATVEENSTPAYVNKYLLELDDTDTDLSGKRFTLTVDKITRNVPAELDEEFFTKFDPSGQVTDEAGLRARIAENNASGFNEQGIGMANFAIQRALVEGNDFELPLEMMRRLNEDQDSSFGEFERGVRWMLVRNKIAAENEIELQYEDLREEAAQSLLKMLGGQRPEFLTDEFLDNYVQNMLKDDKQREQLAGSALEKKIMNAVRDQVTFVEKPVGAEEFNQAIKDFNEANQPDPEEE